ncbi:hypothetical protein diail_4184 [Diaporthe ilicicola]|nr:hypothetical protein diail_4184 [Diaporthe ilicicola]
MVPSSTATAVFLAGAASPLLKPALATSNSHLNPDIMHAHNFNPSGIAAQWSQPQAQDAAAPAVHMEHQDGLETNEHDGTEGTEAPQSTASEYEQTLTQQPQDDNAYSATGRMPLDGGAELKLKRSEEGGGGAVLLTRETSAAPTIFGFSIWLILVWLALLYLMYKTGSMF